MTGMFTDNFNDAAKSAEKLSAAVGGLSREIKKVKSDMRGVAAGFDKFNDIKLRGPAGSPRSARGGGTASKSASVTEWDGFLTAAHKVFEEIKARAGALWENVIKPLGGNIAAWAGAAWEAIKNTFSGAGTWFGTNVINPVAGFFKSLWGNTSSGAKAAWAGVSAAFRNAGAWFGANVINPTVGFFRSLWNSASAGAGAAWAGVSGAFRSAGAWFSTAVTAPIRGFFAGTWDHVKSGATGAWAHISSAFKTASEWFNSTVVKPISAFFGGLWNGIKSGGGALSGWMTSYVINPIVSAFRGMHNGVAGIMEAAINGFVGAINGFIRGVNWVIDTINKIPGVNLGKMGYMNSVRVPRLAAGGLAMGAVTAVVGDNFNARQDPEVIAPLSNLQRMITNAIVQRDMAAGGASGPIEIRLTLQNGAALAELLIDPLNRTAKNLGYAPVFKAV